jgi:predicted amidohydrolase
MKGSGNYMTIVIKVAAIQMDAGFAPKEERLSRAKEIMLRAVEQGAQLLVLPELFNTGYVYSDAVYAQVELSNGLTATWMRNFSAAHGVHLAGTFLRCEEDEIFNTMLLTAPDGREWQYDKHYPWVWERAYFRGGSEVMVADTDLGRLGLLICWDVAHTDLWARYADQVQMMVVCSCPPLVHRMVLHMPDGLQVPFESLGPVQAQIQQTADDSFGSLLRRQAVHLGVPLVNTTGTGRFSSLLPKPRASLMGMAMTAPRLWKYLPQADKIRVEAGYFEETYLADASGEVLAQVPAGEEGFVIAEVELPDSPPLSKGKPPAYGLSVFSYLFDRYANLLLAGEYKRKKGQGGINE